MEATYIDHLGDDLRVVNAARVSFDKESYYEERIIDPETNTTLSSSKLYERDKKLINYLARHGHWTPFAHPQITMRETVPLAIARQRFKHTVGFTYNEVSRRYVDDAPEFFIPDEWRSRPDGSVKQGSGGPSPLSCHFSIKYREFLEHAKGLYNAMINKGIAPEQARLVLPQSMYTSYYVTGSLAAWARAYNQRSDSHAQKEIRQLAEQWHSIIEPLFPTSWEALTGGE